MSAADPSASVDSGSSGQVPPLRSEAVSTFSTSAAGSPRAASLWAGALTAALLAGLGSWLVGERFSGYYKPSHEAASQPYSFTALRAEKLVADSRNTAIAYGSLGVLLGVGLGLAGGLARRANLAALAAAAGGGLLGGVAGVGLSYALVPVYLREVDPVQPTLLLPLMIHGGIWTAIGAASGLAFGLGRGGWSRIFRATLGGAVGAMLGTVAFVVLQAVAFPLHQNEELLGPTPALRLAAVLCVALSVAAGVVVQESESARRVPLKT